MQMRLTLKTNVKGIFKRTFECIYMLILIANQDKRTRPRKTKRRWILSVSTLRSAAFSPTVFCISNINWLIQHMFKLPYFLHHIHFSQQSTQIVYCC